MDSNSRSSMMPEAEVAILLATHFIEQLGAVSVEVALDGAQVQIKERVVFPLKKFLTDHGWKQESSEGIRPWNGYYVKNAKRLHIHARPGHGDVVAVVGRHRYYAECKKGPTQKKRGNPEYRLLREAIGQLMTISEIKTDDILIVAVPDSPKFRSLTSSWQSLPAIRRAKISFVCVDREGSVQWISEKSLT